jgi:hypothetical protein
METMKNAAAMASMTRSSMVILSVPSRTVSLLRQAALTRLKNSRLEGDWVFVRLVLDDEIAHRAI